jgi:hypothetical protein
MRTATAVDVSDMKSSCYDGFASSSCISTPSSSCCVVDKSLNESETVMVSGNFEFVDESAHSSMPIYENVFMLTPCENSPEISEDIQHTNDGEFEFDLRKEIEDEILKNFLCNDDDDDEDDDALTSSKYSKEDDDVVSSRYKCEMQPQLSLYDDMNVSATAASVNVDENVRDCGVLLKSKSPKFASTKKSDNGRKTVRKNFSLWIGVTSCVWGLLLLLVKNYVN